MSDNKNKFQNHRNSEVGEDTTKYGEFISSFFHGYHYLSKKKMLID